MSQTDFITGFEGFEGVTSRIGGVTPSALYGRNGGKGMGINGLGFLVGQGWGMAYGGPVTFAGTVGFAFKSYSDATWGGNVRLCRMWNQLWNVDKLYLEITAQKQLHLWSYDRAIGAMVPRAFSTLSLRDDAWHYIEVLFFSGGGSTCDFPVNGAVRAYVNGRLFVEFEGSTDFCIEDDPDPYYPKRGCTDFQVGVLGGIGSEARHMAFDDVYAAASSLVFGDMFASELVLESDSIAELTPVPTDDNFENVNEDPTDDEDTYNVNLGLTRQDDLYEIVDVAGPLEGRVIAVQLSTRIRKVGTALWEFQPYLEIEDNPYRQYHLNRPIPEEWTDFHTVFWEANGPPDGSGYTIGHDWTWEEVQDLRAGYTLIPVSNFNDFHASALTPAVYNQV